MELFAARDSRIVTLTIKFMFVNIYKCIPFSDPIVFVLNLGLLISKKKECGQYVFMWVCFYNSNTENTSFILEQVTFSCRNPGQTGSEGLHIQALI